MRMRMLSGAAFLAGVACPGPAAPQAPSLPAVAAEVNGEKVPTQEWVDRMAALRAQDFLSSVNPPRFKPGAAGEIVLRSLISSRLLLQYAARTSLLPTREQVDAALAEALKRPEVADAIARKELAEDYVRRQVLYEQALFNVATINRSVTPAEVEAYYRANLASFTRPERWRLGLIRVPTEQAAARVMDGLKRGVSFEKLAAEHSDDPATRARGGDAGFVHADDAGLPEVLRSAVRGLKPGQAAGPVRISVGTQSAFLIVRLTAREPLVTTPLEAVRTRVERMALFEKAGGVAAVERKLDEFRRTSRVVIHLPGWEDLYKREARQP